MLEEQFSAKQNCVNLGTFIEMGSISPTIAIDATSGLERDCQAHKGPVSSSRNINIYAMWCGAYCSMHKAKARSHSPQY